MELLIGVLRFSVSESMTILEKIVDDEIDVKMPNGRENSRENLRENGNENGREKEFSREFSKDVSRDVIDDINNNDIALNIDNNNGNIKYFGKRNSIEKRTFEEK